MLCWTLVALLFLPQDSLRDLDSPDSAVARRAFDAVVREGDEAALENLAKVSERARFALAEIRAHRRFGSSYPLSPLITMEISRRPLREALAEFSKSTGMRIESANDKENPNEPASAISFTCDRLFPVEAIERFSLSANIKLIRLGDRLLWYPGAKKERAVSVSRHFTVSLGSLSETETRTSAGEMIVDCFMSILVESDGLVRIAGQGPMRLTEAVDDRGVSLLRKNIPPPSSGGWAPFSNFNAGVAIEPPNPESRTLRVLKGSVEILIAEGPREEDVDLSLEPVDVRLPNLSLRLKLSADGSRIAVTGKILDPAVPYAWPCASDIRLRGRDGRLLESNRSLTGTPVTIQDELSYAIPAGFITKGVRIRSFTGAGPFEIPFEFRGVAIR